MNIVLLIGLLFVGLKLAEVGIVAQWSWWLVLLPFYGGLAIMGIMALISLIILITTQKKVKSYRLNRANFK